MVVRTSFITMADPHAKLWRLFRFIFVLFFQGKTKTDESFPGRCGISTSILVCSTFVS